jgi:hypothetical protein
LPILFSKSIQFFLIRHAPTLSGFLLFGKSVGGVLSSYISPA